MSIRKSMKNGGIFTLILSGMITIALISSSVDTADAATAPWNPGTITSISAGGGHACAIASGKAYCWGNNFSGQIGNGQDTGGNVGLNVPYPVAVDTTGALSGKTLTHVSAGKHSTCAIDTESSLYCWGDNSQGQLGDGTTTKRLSPVKVGGLLAGKQVTQVSIGNYEYDRSDVNVTCAIADGKAYCWGNNGFGQIGDNTRVDKNTPVAVSVDGALAGKTVAQVAITRASVCAVTTDGKAACWGSNSNGEFGNNTTTSSNTPTMVDMSGVLAGKTITQLAIRESGACVLASGNVYCWGYNTLGQLGTGTGVTFSRVPVAVDASGALAGKSVTDITSGAYHTCATTSDSGMYCWGSNDHGQLTGTVQSSNTPRSIDKSGVLANKPISMSTAGDTFTCAASSAEAYCWGDNYFYNLGAGYLASEANASSGTVVAVSKNIPVISSISPATLDIGSGDKQVTISGSGISSKSKVIIGGIEYGGNNSSYEYIGNEIVVTIPAANITEEKTVDVKIINPDGESITKNQSVTFQHATPVVSSVYPTNIALTYGATETIYISSASGKFLPGATVKVGGVDATVVNTTANQIQATFLTPEGINGSGAWDIKVTNPSGASFTANGAIAYDAIVPSVTTIEPATGFTDSDNTITITGSGLARYSWLSPKLYVGGQEASLWYSATNPDDGTVMSYTYGISRSSVAGKVDVVIANSDGFRQTVVDGYEYIVKPLPEIVINSVSPNQVKTEKSGQSIAISGAEFADGLTVDIGGQPATPYYVDPNNIYVDAPQSNTVGPVDVKVTNVNGKSFTYPNGLTYYKPAPKMVNGATFTQGSGMKLLSIAGTSLVGVDDTGEYVQALERSLVTLNGVPLKFCAEGLASAYEGAGYSPEFFSDEIPCYELFNYTDGALITAEKATIRLPDDFDVTAQGTVSVNGSNTYTFNKVTTPGNEIAAPTVIVENKSLEVKPVISKRPTFSGTAEPGATVIVTVRSDPIICTTTADTNGNWSCTLPSDLPAGNHTVTVQVTNPDASIDELGPYAVTVAGASAAAATTVTSATPLAPNTGVGRALSQSPSLLLIGAVIMTALCTYFGLRISR